jgi:hypothetical protein
MALPAGTLITVPEWKQWANLGHDEALDDLIEDLILTAEAQIQDYCRRVFKNAVIVEEKHDGKGTSIITVDRPPITSISELKYGNAEPYSAIESGDYVFYSDSGIVQLLGEPSIVSSEEYSWISRFPVGQRNVLISYTGGPTAAPAPVLLALKMQVSALWYSRGRDPEAISHSVGSASKTRSDLDGSGLARSVVAKLGPYRKLLISMIQAPLVSY